MLEKKLLSLPPAIQLIKGNKEGDSLAGLTIRYRNSENKWTCHYGYYKSINDKFNGIGNTPTEAVDDLIIKLRNYNG